MRKYQKWAVIGRLAAIALRAPGAGSRLARENELASSLGLSRPTLRHYRDAVANVRSIDDWPTRQRLLGGTAVAANTLTRWLRRDHAGAVNFMANNLVFSDAQVTAAARQAGPVQRARGRLDLPLPALVSDALKFAGSTLNSELHLEPQRMWFDPRLVQLRFESRATEDASAQFLGIELELVQAAIPLEAPDVDESNAVPQHRLVGALVPVPRFVVFERYRQEARATWARLVAASVLYPLVVAVFHGPAARRYFLSGIPAGIRNTWTGLDGGASQAGGKCRSRPIWFRPNPRTGLIVLSTRPGLAVDLFELARKYDVLPGAVPRRWNGPTGHSE